MPSRFDKYRMKDGLTKLGGAYFNPLLQDIDLRIAALEALEISWKGAVATVSEYGLARINETVGPVVSDLEDASAAAEEKRQAALSAIEQLNAAIAAVPALAVNIDAINGRFTALEKVVPTKADAEAMNEALAQKAAQEDLDAAVVRLPVFAQPDDLGIFELIEGQSAGQLAAVDLSLIHI